MHGGCGGLILCVELGRTGAPRAFGNRATSPAVGRGRRMDRDATTALISTSANNVASCRGIATVLPAFWTAMNTKVWRATSLTSKVELHS